MCFERRITELLFMIILRTILIPTWIKRYHITYTHNIHDTCLTIWTTTSVLYRIMRFHIMFYSILFKIFKDISLWSYVYKYIGVPTYESLSISYGIVLFFHCICFTFHVSDCVIYLPKNRTTTANNNKRNARGSDRKKLFPGGVERVVIFLYFFFFRRRLSNYFSYCIHTYTHNATLPHIRLPVVISGRLVLLLYYLLGPYPVVSFIREPTATAMTTRIAPRTVRGGARVHHSQPPSARICRRLRTCRERTESKVFPSRPRPKSAHPSPRLSIHRPDTKSFYITIHRHHLEICV